MCFLKLLKSVEYDLIMSKLVAHLYIETQLSNKDSCVEISIDLFIHMTGETWNSEIQHGDKS